MRQLLGKAVRAQTEQQHEIETLSETLREERTAASNAREMASNAQRDAQQLRDEVKSLTEQLATEQVRGRVFVFATSGPPLASPVGVLLSPGATLDCLSAAHHVRTSRASPSSQAERMESESAALEREEQLEAKVEELEEAERRRVALEKAMEVAMATEAPMSKPAPIAVQVSAPPSAPPPGFDMSAGGFSL